jgi:hypothetical protein
MADETSFWPKLVLAVLATWRITHLLAREDGPADLVARLRAGLGASFAGRLLDCFYCLSLWVAAPVALWLSTRPLDWVLGWLAISGAACLLVRIGQWAGIMHALPEQTKGETDGMLWTETDRIPAHVALGDDADARRDATGQRAGRPG